MRYPRFREPLILNTLREALPSLGNGAARWRGGLDDHPVEAAVPKVTRCLLIAVEDRVPPEQERERHALVGEGEGQVPALALAGKDPELIPGLRLGTGTGKA